MTEQTSKPRVRSPAYPSMGLPAAIERAKTLYEKEGYGRHSIMAETIAKDWDYAGLNGSALTAISALKQFGLLFEIDVEEGKPRQLKLTPWALCFIVRKSDSPEWSNTIRKAALQPKLYDRLWKKYAWPLPSDHSISTYLELEEGYNTKFIAGIIEDYKATIALAKLNSDDKIGGVEAVEISGSPIDGEDEALTQSTEITDLSKSKGHTSPPPVGTQKDFPLYLSNNKRAILYIPSTMTAKDYELLKKQIENHLLVIEATSVSEDQAKN